MEKTKMYLYNPINNVKTETNYTLLSGITGSTEETLRSLKSKRKRVAQLNCFIVDDSFTSKELHVFMESVKISDEIWKNIRGYDSKYLISSYGRVAKIYKNGKRRILMPVFDSKSRKRLVIKLTKNGKSVWYFIHKLVAEHFIDNPNRLPSVWHKNRNIQDNFAGNLEWISKEELGKKTGGLSRGKPVLKLDANTLEVVNEYNNIEDAAKDNYVCRETMRCWINGIYKSHDGFKWVYDEGDIV